MNGLFPISGETAAWAAVALILVYLILDYRRLGDLIRRERLQRRYHSPRPGRIALWRSWTDSTGSMAVEFALLGPVLVLLLMAIVSYGSWLWLAQSIQGIASEAARASIGGLNDAEREALARAEVATHAGRLFQVAPEDVVVDVETDASQLVVRLSYDSSGHPLMQAATLLPRPPEQIEGVAVVRTGGY